MIRAYQSTLAAAALLVLSPVVSSAQQARCAAGVAANNECANEEMLTEARRTAMIFSQPKISLTAYPVLPSLDRLYRYPNQLIPDLQRSTAVGQGPGFE
jgi:hypothetical protein